MRISFNLFNQQGVNAITDQQARLVHTQLQLATQKRVLSPSEDPVASTQIASFKNDISQFERYKVNAESAQGFNELEDTLLMQAQDLLTRVRELILRGGDGAYGVAERNALASETEVRLHELIGLANTKNSAGEYMFSGFKTDTLPFTLNAAGGVVYNGDQGQRELNTSSSVTVAVADSGYAVFQNIRNGNGDFTVSATATNTGTGVMSPGTVSDRSAYIADTYTLNFYTNGAGQLVYDVNGAASGAVQVGVVFAENGAVSFNGITTSIDEFPLAGDSFTLTPSTDQDVFTTIQAAIAAFRTPTTTGPGIAQMRIALDQALVSLDQALTNVDSVRSQVGARLNIVDAELAHNQSVQLQNRTTLSNLEDLDAVEAISRLQQQTTALDAAQRSFSAIQNLSLFRFI